MNLRDAVRRVVELHGCNNVGDEADSEIKYLKWWLSGEFTPPLTPDEAMTIVEKRFVEDMKKERDGK